MKRRSALMATASMAATLVAAACGPSGPPPPPPWSPVGTFSFVTVAPDIGTISGTITIQDNAGSLGGGIDVEGGMVPSMSLLSVDVGNMAIELQADFGGEVLFMEMNFANDDDYTGYWSVGGESGDISGRRVAM